MNEDIIFTAIVAFTGTLIGSLGGIYLTAYLKRKQDTLILLIDSYANYFSSIMAAFYARKEMNQAKSNSEEYLAKSKEYDKQYDEFNKYGAILSLLCSKKVKKHIEKIDDKWNEIKDRPDEKSEKELRYLLDQLPDMIESDIR
jgi:dsRNA-specific ribonuclease